MSAFDLLSPAMRDLLVQKGFGAPTPPQERMIPVMLARKDALLIAPTGIGKTEAAVLPILDMLASRKKPGVRLVYVTPLRALNRDMLSRLTWFGERLGLSIAVRHGDTPQSERARQVKHVPDVLITTPETLQIMFQGKRTRKTLAQVEHVVVDEIHELARDERGAQLSVALERLVAVTGGREFQRVGLSATVGNPQEVADFLGGRRGVEIVDVVHAKEYDILVEAPKKEKEDEKLAERFELPELLASALRHAKDVAVSSRSTLFFTNTRDTAEMLAARYGLWEESPGFGVHHGSLSTAVRVEMEDAFKAGTLRCLVCTSSLELGIDVGQTELAVQFSSPREVTRLIQRVGRSGHGLGRKSVGRIVAWSPDDIMESAVIARMAMESCLEGQTIRRDPLSVLANQIMSTAMEHGTVKADHLYKLMRRAFPFRNLERSAFEETVLLLDQLGQVRLMDGEVRRTRRTLEYFYSNISMIPDQRTYRIFDVGSRRTIGTLDEGFVATLADGYQAFIVRGTTWRVVDVQEDEVLVERAKELGAIPSWVGEEIPVPYEVAREVGRLRRLGDIDAYPMDAEAGKRVGEYLAKQTKNHPMPSDTLVTVERRSDSVVVNACFGTKANQTIARWLSVLLMARLESSIGVVADPYRMELRVPRSVRGEDVLDMLTGSDPAQVGPLLRLHLQRSTYLKWQFLHVAKKFGAVQRDADIKALNVDRMMERFKGTPLMDEVVEKVLYETMDVPLAERLVGEMASGKIEVMLDRPSPIGESGEMSIRELLAPERATAAILEALKRRLHSRRVVLGCVNCGSIQRGEVCSFMGRKLSCRVCGGAMMAPLRDGDESLVRGMKRGNLDYQQSKRISELMVLADLVNANGGLALVALAGRGVGAKTAARVLERAHGDESLLLREILAAEVNYAKNKRFWD